MKNKVKMKLVGMDGNAFAIMGNFSRQAKKAGWTSAEVNEVMSKAMSGDYNNLLATIMDNVE